MLDEFQSILQDLFTIINTLLDSGQVIFDSPSMAQQSEAQYDLTTLHQEL